MSKSRLLHPETDIEPWAVGEFGQLCHRSRGLARSALSRSRQHRSARRLPEPGDAAPAGLIEMLVPPGRGLENVFDLGRPASRRKPPLRRTRGKTGKKVRGLCAAAAIRHKPLGHRSAGQSEEVRDFSLRLIWRRTARVPLKTAELSGKPCWKNRGLDAFIRGRA
jgi:hypothetical protein